MEACFFRNSSPTVTASQTRSECSLSIKSPRPRITSIPSVLCHNHSSGTRASSKADLTRSGEVQTGARKIERPYNDIALSARVSNHSGFPKLMGCCLEFTRPVVVFENPEYGVLNVRGSVGCEDAPLLPWNVRLKIAKEVATAITYLHTAFPRIIIHRDIKATNVLLDKNWTAKLTGFSLAVTLPEGKSWIEDTVTGTIGYVDSVYLSTGLVSEYTDVYSFGILMLVLLMGRNAFLLPEYTDHVMILDYVKDLQERGEPVEFGGDSNDMRPDQMKMFLELALRCCEKRNEDRLKMILVAKELKLIEQASLHCYVAEEDLPPGDPAFSPAASFPGGEPSDSSDPLSRLSSLRCWKMGLMMVRFKREIMLILGLCIVYCWISYLS